MDVVEAVGRTKTKCQESLSVQLSYDDKQYSVCSQHSNVPNTNVLGEIEKEKDREEILYQGQNMKHDVQQNDYLKNDAITIISKR